VGEADRRVLGRRAQRLERRREQTVRGGRERPADDRRAASVPQRPRRRASRPTPGRHRARLELERRISCVLNPRRRQPGARCFFLRLAGAKPGRRRTASGSAIAVSRAAASASKTPVLSAVFDGVSQARRAMEASAPRRPAASIASRTRRHERAGSPTPARSNLRNGERKDDDDG
jgi:hypothetical protein